MDLDQISPEAVGSAPRMLRRPRRCVLLGLAAAMTVIAVTATSAVALTGSHKVSNRLAPRSTQPAAVTTVRRLASKTVKQHATGAGATAALTTVGPISARAKCTDMGSGTFKVELQMKSSPAGAILLGSNGSTKLTTSFATIYNAFNSVGYGYGAYFDAMTSGGTFQHYKADFSIHQLGNDCVTRVAVTSE